MHGEALILLLSAGLAEGRTAGPVLYRFICGASGTLVHDLDYASSLAGTLLWIGLLTVPAIATGAAVIASDRSSQQDARLLGGRRWVGESAGSTVLAGVARLVWGAA